LNWQGMALGRRKKKNPESGCSRKERLQGLRKKKKIIEKARGQPPKGEPLRRWTIDGGQAAKEILGAKREAKLQGQGSEDVKRKKRGPEASL